MANDTRYNGWTNYETWCVNLWLTNDSASDSYWRETAQECFDDAETDSCFTREERAVLTLADRLKEETEEANVSLTDRLNGTMFSDLLGAALSEVNWYEIAEHFIEDCNQTVTEDDLYEDIIQDENAPDLYLENAQAHIPSDAMEDGMYSRTFDTLAHARYLISENKPEDWAAYFHKLERPE